MNVTTYTFSLLALSFLTVEVSAAESIAEPRPVPRLQVIPLPHHEISFQRDGRELARYHYAPDLMRPFLYPIIGPAGRSLTRMGHPHDPESHSHHNSVWISHHDVNGVDFWGDRARKQGRIAHQRVERLVDGDKAAFIEVLNHWQSADRVLLVERRRITAQTLPDDEWLLVLDLRIEAKGEPVVLGKTPFGFVGVRMAKTIGVHDGAGTIRNSEGGINERGVFWKPSRWVDYSGLIAPGRVEGLALFDDSGNSNHPSVFHVRDDGWMGASFTHGADHTLPPGEVLALRYAIYVHGDRPSHEALDAQWRKFSDSPVVEFPDQR